MSVFQIAEMIGLKGKPHASMDIDSSQHKSPLRMLSGCFTSALPVRILPAVNKHQIQKIIQAEEETHESILLSKTHRNESPKSTSCAPKVSDFYVKVPTQTVYQLHLQKERV